MGTIGTTFAEVKVAQKSPVPPRLVFSRFREAGGAEPYIPLAKAADKLCLKKGRLLRLAAEKHIPHKKDGRQLLFAESIVTDLATVQESLPAERVNAMKAAEMLGLRYSAFICRLRAGRGTFYYTDLNGDRKGIACQRDIANHLIFDKRRVESAVADFDERKDMIPLSKASRLLGLAARGLSRSADSSRNVTRVKLSDGSSVDIPMKMWGKTTFCVARRKILELHERNRQFELKHRSIGSTVAALGRDRSVIRHAAAELGIEILKHPKGHMITVEDHGRIKKHLEIKKSGFRTLHRALGALHLSRLPEPAVVARGGRFFAVIGDVITGIPELRPVETEVYPAIHRGKKVYIMTKSAIEELRCNGAAKRLGCIQALQNTDFRRFRNEIINRSVEDRQLVVKRAFFIANLVHDVPVSALVRFVKRAKNSEEALTEINHAWNRDGIKLTRADVTGYVENRTLWDSTVERLRGKQK